MVSSRASSAGWLYLLRLFYRPPVLRIFVCLFVFLPLMKNTKMSPWNLSNVICRAVSKDIKHTWLVVDVTCELAYSWYNWLKGNNFVMDAKVKVTMDSKLNHTSVWKSFKDLQGFLMIFKISTVIETLKILKDLDPWCLRTFEINSYQDLQRSWLSFQRSLKIFARMFARHLWFYIKNLLDCQRSL